MADPKRELAKEIDRMALDGSKSEWQERTAPAASDPVSDAERVGLNVLGQSDPRHDGALGGVSDPNAGDVNAAAPITTQGNTHRTNPPLTPEAGTGDGGITVSGGAAGGA